MNDRVFISYKGADLNIQGQLASDAKSNRTPFFFVDNSLTEAIEGSDAWKNAAREKIDASFFVIVLCGKHSEQSVGQSIELQYAKETGKPYALVRATRDVPTKPRAASQHDEIHKYTWDTIAMLLREARPS